MYSCSSISNWACTCTPGYLQSMLRRQSVARVSECSYSARPFPSSSPCYHWSVSSPPEHAYSSLQLIQQLQRLLQVLSLLVNQPLRSQNGLLLLYRELRSQTRHILTFISLQMMDQMPWSRKTGLWNSSFSGKSWRSVMYSRMVWIVEGLSSCVSFQLICNAFVNYESPREGGVTLVGRRRVLRRSRWYLTVLRLSSP